MRAYILQRATAALMLPLILAHVGLIFYATQGGLTAAEVLARTRGSFGWALFYGGFVVLASIHGAIGVRTVLGEWAGQRGRVTDAMAGVFGLVLLVLGVRAVVAVVFPGSVP